MKVQAGFHTTNGLQVRVWLVVIDSTVIKAFDSLDAAFQYVDSFLEISQ